MVRTIGGSSWIAILRIRHAMSLEAVGQVIGVTYQQVQKYETGHNRLSTRNMYVLARSFGVDITAFYDGLDGRETAHTSLHDPVLAEKLARITRDRPKAGDALKGLAEALARA